MAIREDMRVELVSEPRLLKTVRAVVRNYAESRGVPPGRIDEMVLAVDEACANVIRHAYNGHTDERFTLSFRSDERSVEIELGDHGRPVPLDRVRRKDGPTPPAKENLKPGGLGVQIMYRVFDEVEFRPGCECGNSVRMKLRLPSASEQQTVAAECDRG